MNTSPRRTFLQQSIALLSASALPGIGSRPTFAATSSSASTSAGLPKYSDVVLSSRFARPNTLEVLKQFSATRCEWVYTEDRAFVASVKTAVSHVGLTLASTSAATDDHGAALNADGKPFTAPWMKGTSFRWGSSIRTAGRQKLISQALNYAALGANSVQLDDPALEYAALDFAGGDFSEEAISGFSSFLKSHSEIPQAARANLSGSGDNILSWVKGQNAGSSPTDWPGFNRQHASDPVWAAWKRYLQTSVGTFLHDLREALHAAPNPALLSMNCPNPLPLEDRAFMIDETDYLISEVAVNHGPQQLFAYSASAHAFGKPFTCTLPVEQTKATRWKIALTYALGARAIVPWDVYIPGQISGNSPRYFGSVEDYGDLYKFVRTNAMSFDDFEQVADIAVVIGMPQATQPQMEEVAASCARLGGCAFVVVRSDGRVQGLQQYQDRSPVIVIPIGVADSVASKLFPQAKLMQNSQLASLTLVQLPASASAVQTSVPNGLFGVLRRKKSTGEMVVHVVNTAFNSADNSAQRYCDVLIANTLLGSTKMPNSGRLMRPGMDNIDIPLTATKTPQGTVLRFALTAPREWCIIKLNS